MTAYGLGPFPVAAAAPQAGPRPPGLAPVGADFWRSPAFGLLILAGVVIYLHARIL